MNNTKIANKAKILGQREYYISIITKKSKANTTLSKIHIVYLFYGCITFSLILTIVSFNQIRGVHGRVWASSGPGSALKTYPLA